MSGSKCCPHCPERDNGACIITFVDLVHGYVEEPAEFDLDGFHHVHDPNPLIATWRCKNGHLFKISATRPCHGCVAEKENTRKNQQEQETRTNHAMPYSTAQFVDQYP